MTHTKEPWRANHANAGNCGYEVAGGDRFLTQVCDDVREDNAIRIVACVNALEGLSNDALDGGWNFKEMSAYTKRLEQALAGAKAAYVELTNNVSFADNGEAAYVADIRLMSKFDSAFDQA